MYVLPCSGVAREVETGVFRLHAPEVVVALRLYHIAPVVVVFHAGEEGSAVVQQTRTGSRHLADGVGGILLAIAAAAVVAQRHTRYVAVAVVEGLGEQHRTGKRRAADTIARRSAGGDDGRCQRVGQHADAVGAGASLARSSPLVRQHIAPLAPLPLVAVLREDWRVVRVVDRILPVAAGQPLGYLAVAVVVAVQVGILFKDVAAGAAP